MKKILKLIASILKKLLVAITTATRWNASMG